MRHDILGSLSASSYGTLVRVKTRPRSRSFKIVPICDHIMVDCKNPPEKGKANREMLRKMSGLFHHRTRIVSGHRSRTKVILIEMMDPGEVMEILSAIQSEPGSPELSE